MDDDKELQGQLQEETPTEQLGERDNPVEEPQYSPEEIADIGIESLDPTRIPPELIPWYKSMLRDYRAKTEQVAREREEIRRQAERQPDPQVQLTPAQINQIKVRQIAEASKLRACREYLGIDPSQFSEFDADHITAFHMAQREITDAVRAEEARQQESVRRRSTVDEILSEYRIKEPHFAEIDKWAGEYVDQLPAKENRKFFAAIASGDKSVIREVVEEIRRSWYEQQKTVKKGVPPLEKGESSQAPKKQANARAFGTLSEEEQVEFLKNYA